MMTIKTSELKRVILDTARHAGVDVHPVSEAYVSLPKKFQLSGESSSKETKKLHVDLYENYVKKFNRNSAEIDGIDRTSDDAPMRLRQLKLEESFLLNAVYLHELYFANSYDAQSEILVESLAYMRLQRDWGSFEQFQHDFIAIALAARQGWALTCFNSFLQRYMTIFIDGQISCVPVGLFPIIVQDLHEHAYFHDYGNDKKAFIIAQMKQWNWNVIDERCQRAEMIAEAVR